MAYDTAWANSAQNARVLLDRISRELRQAKDVVTQIPANEDDESIQQPHLIEFEDGHANDLTYRRYYLEGTTLKLDVKEYYMASDPSTRVKWDTTNNGTPAVSSVISSVDVAEMVQSLRFYGGNTIQIVIQTGDGTAPNVTMQTSIQGRNR